MAPEKAPAFQFYPKDFLSDENQSAMSLPEVGAYARLMARCWLEGSLPDDLSKLGRLCGASKTMMTQMWPAISPCFRQREDGRWQHPRLDKERDKQDKFRRRQIDAVESRWKRAKASQTDTAVLPEKVVVTTDKPRVYSSISDLPSPISPLPTAVSDTRAPSALAGTLPREHLRHSWCSSRGKCVPEFLHGEFIRAVGGEERGADQKLKAFYEAVERGWPEGPIGDDPVKLWRREFAAKFPSVAPVAKSAAAPVGRRSAVPAHEPL